MHEIGSSLKLEVLERLHKKAAFEMHVNFNTPALVRAE